MSNYIIWLYVTYLLFISAATIYVGKTLFYHSKVFMSTIFNGRDHLAIATNKLFEMGFFLVAFGLGFWYLKTNYEVIDVKAFFETISYKAGSYTLFLGILLMLNLYLFFRGMKYRNAKKNTTSNNIN